MFSVCNSVVAFSKSSSASPQLHSMAPETRGEKARLKEWGEIKASVWIMQWGVFFSALWEWESRRWGQTFKEVVRNQVLHLPVFPSNHSIKVVRVHIALEGNPSKLNDFSGNYSIHSKHMNPKTCRVESNVYSVSPYSYCMQESIPKQLKTSEDCLPQVWRDLRSQPHRLLSSRTRCCSRHPSLAWGQLGSLGRPRKWSEVRHRPWAQSLSLPSRPCPGAGKHGPHPLHSGYDCTWTKIAKVSVLKANFIHCWYKIL